jgi:hypothetical protein
MSVKYDPEVIQEFATRLYKKASSITASYTVLGVILLGFGGLLTQQPIFALIGAVVGGAIGYSMGRERAFSYKLQAQTALCQVHIESNLRSGAE